MRVSGAQAFRTTDGQGEGNLLFANGCFGAAAIDQLSKGGRDGSPQVDTGGNNET